MEVFDDSDKVGADVVLLDGFPQSCMPNSVEGLLEVYEDMVEVLLVLEIYLSQRIRRLNLQLAMIVSTNLRFVALAEQNDCPKIFHVTEPSRNTLTHRNYRYPPK